MRRRFQWPGAPNLDSYRENFCAGNEFLVITPDGRTLTVEDLGREAAWTTPEEPEKMGFWTDDDPSPSPTHGIPAQHQIHCMRCYLMSRDGVRAKFQTLGSFIQHSWSTHEGEVDPPAPWVRPDPEHVVSHEVADTRPGLKTLPPRSKMPPPGVLPKPAAGPTQPPWPPPPLLPPGGGVPMLVPPPPPPPVHPPAVVPAAAPAASSWAPAAVRAPAPTPAPAAPKPAAVPVPDLSAMPPPAEFPPSNKRSFEECRSGVVNKYAAKRAKAMRDFMSSMVEASKEFTNEMSDLVYSDWNSSGT